jgi:DNA repair exonuclease SbcCD nuclease subunit
MSRSRTVSSLLILVAVVTAFCVHQAFGQTPPDTLRFAFITDLHFGKTDYNGESLFPAPWLKEAIAGMEREKAEFIFVGGDLIECANSAGQYAMFDSAMVTAISWYPMPGNHDIGDRASATLEKITIWAQRGYGRGTNNREYYGFVKKQLGAFFVLNTQAYTSTDPSVLARADSQLVEMDNFFTVNAAVPKKFVCAHVPLIIDSQLEDSTGYFSIGPAYRKRILSLMDKHNAQYYLAGHRHVDAVKTDGNITVYANTALSFQLGTGNQRGYYIYTVTSGSVKREFFPLSLEPDLVR